MFPAFNAYTSAILQRDSAASAARDKLISYNRGGGVAGNSRLISHSQIEYISYVFTELQLVLAAIS